MISLKNIYKSYWQGEEEIAILKNINLEIEKGDYISIMGPSEIWEIYLMNIIGCLDKPTSGDYHIYDTDIF